MGGRAYPVRHYPIAIRLRDRGGSRHSMSCAISSEWGLFGRKTRSAIQGTSSPRKLRSQNAEHTTVREQYFQLCGLRPRIKRHGCTFEGTSRKNAGPSSKVRSHNAAHLHQNRT